MRVLLIMCSVVLALGVCLLTVRQWGQSQPVIEYPLEFFRSDNPPLRAGLLWDGQLPRPPHGHLVGDGASDDIPSDETLWMATIRQNLDQEIVASPFEKHKAFQEDKNDKGSAVPLEKLILAFPGRRWLLSVDSNVENIDLKISQILTSPAMPRDLARRIIIHSEFDVVAQSLKQQLPQYAFASSLAEQMRLLTFESLWILPATPMHGDLWFGPLRRGSVQMITPAIVAELRRRKKRIFLGPLQGSPGSPGGAPEEISAVSEVSADLHIYLQKPY